ncbi:MAG: energy-coupling factor ABC transporter permease [Brevinematia bacterium]
MDMINRILLITLMVIMITPLIYACHIAEGILSIEWVIFWSIASMVFIVLSIAVITNNIKNNKNYIAVISLVSALVFVMTSLPVPSPVAGTVSHPGATGISAVILGPVVSVFIGFITLLIQALFMAHGGVTSLGANVFAMAVVGSFVGFALYKLSRLIKLPYIIAGFFAGFFADISTYLTTALQLSLELHGSEPIIKSWLTIFGMFLPTQLPVAIISGIVTGMVIKIFIERASEYIDPPVEKMM